MFTPLPAALSRVVRRNEQASRQCFSELLSSINPRSLRQHTLRDHHRASKLSTSSQSSPRNPASTQALSLKVHLLHPTAEAPHPVAKGSTLQLPHRPRTPASCSSRPKSRLPAHHASAPRAASGNERKVLSSSSPTLHPVIAFFLTSSLHSFLAAWTPPAGSLDPHSLHRPSAWHSFVFSKTKRCLL